MNSLYSCRLKALKSAHWRLDLLDAQDLSLEQFDRLAGAGLEGEFGK